MLKNSFVGFSEGFFKVQSNFLSVAEDIHNQQFQAS